MQSVCVFSCSYEISKKQKHGLCNRCLLPKEDSMMIIIIIIMEFKRDLKHFSDKQNLGMFHRFLCLELDQSYIRRCSERCNRCSGMLVLVKVVWRRILVVSLYFFVFLVSLCSACCGISCFLGCSCCCRSSSSSPPSSWSSSCCSSPLVVSDVVSPVFFAGFFFPLAFYYPSLFLLFMRHLLCFLFPSLCLNLNVVVFSWRRRSTARETLKEDRRTNKTRKNACTPKKWLKVNNEMCRMMKGSKAIELLACHQSIRQHIQQHIRRPEQAASWLSNYCWNREAER